MVAHLNYTDTHKLLLRSWSALVPLSLVTTTWEVINWSCISIITGRMFASSSSPRESSVRGIVFHRLSWMRHPWIHSNRSWVISGRIWATNKLCFSSLLFIKFKFNWKRTTLKKITHCERKVIGAYYLLSSPRYHQNYLVCGNTFTGIYSCICGNFMFTNIQM